MAFEEQGAPVQQADSAGERWELRNCLFTASQPKTSKNGKEYKRVKDSNSFWYSVWSDSVYQSIAIAAKAEQMIPCAVQIKPGTGGGKPFYTIQGVNAVAEGLVAEGNAKSTVSEAPGGRNSEYGKRTHPVDAQRMSMAASIDRAISCVALFVDERPEGSTKQEFIRAKVFEWANMINDAISKPSAPATQDTAPPPVPVAAGFPVEPEATEDDSDIPF